MCAIPGTGSSSLICWKPISSSPRAITAPTRSPSPIRRLLLMTWSAIAKALIELGGEVCAADARGIADGFRLQEHASQGVGRADVGLGRTGPHRHADGRAGDGPVPVRQHQALRDETAQQAIGDNHDIRDLAALEPVRDRGFARPHGCCPGNDLLPVSRSNCGAKANSAAVNVPDVITLSQCAGAVMVVSWTAGTPSARPRESEDPSCNNGEFWIPAWAGMSG